MDMELRSLEDVRPLLEAARTIVVVGCSTNPVKSANGVPRRLQKAGYRIIPVNPNAGRQLILGEQALDDLRSVAEPVDIVEVFRPSSEAAAVARRAVALIPRPRAVWLQQGIFSDEAARICAEGGVAFVQDRCMATDVALLGIQHAA
jgi:predicted CoA-binding protein